MIHQKVLEKTAHDEQKDGYPRQGLVHLPEDVRDVRHDEGDQKKEDAAPDEEHEERIGQRRTDLGSQGLLAFIEIGQTVQDEIDRSRRLPGPDHVDVEGGKDLREMGHALGQAVPLVDLVLDLGKRRLEHRMPDLGNQRRERGDQRQPRPDEGGKLPRHQGQILESDPPEEMDRPAPTRPSLSASDRRSRRSPRERHPSPGASDARRRCSPHRRSPSVCGRRNPALCIRKPA